MVSSELRANARESLKGKWGKAALLTLCFGLISFVISFVLGFIPAVGPIVNFVITLPISFGFLVSFMKLKRGEEVGYTDFLSTGFSNFGKVWGVFGNMLLKMIIPIVLVVVFLLVFAFSMGGSMASLFATSYGSHSYASAAAGFGGLAIVGLIGYIASIIYATVKGYLYSLSYYILYDNPDKTGKEIVEESESLMKGNRWSFFWLGLTFIGWAILSVFTLYIGMLWLVPYIMVTFVCFYEALAGKSATKTEDTNPVVEE
ncbi:MAG: DUF975 family protein [Clostridia bacterium]|nr:DUF975 family protein [Clostridia bacterium]